MNAIRLLFSTLLLMVLSGVQGCEKDLIDPPSRLPESGAVPQGIRIFKYPVQQQGVRTDFKILEKFTAGRVAVFDQENSDARLAKVNLFVELVIPSWQNHAASNWLVVNHELVQDPSNLKIVDVVLCKTRRCMTLMQKYREEHKLNFRMHFTGFTSDFRPSDDKLDYGLVFHAAGKSPYKNTRVVLDVWRRNPDFPHVFMTCREACIETHLSDFQDWMEIPNARIETENVPLNEYLEIFKRAGIHVAPSSIEGFGHSINEGRSKGAIVITTNAPPMNELIEDNESGFLVNAQISHQFNPYSREVAHDVNSKDLEEVVLRALALSTEEKIEMGKIARENFQLDSDLFEIRLGTIFDVALKGPSSTQGVSLGSRQDKFTIVGLEGDVKALGAVRAFREFGFEAELVGGTSIAKLVDSNFEGRHYLIWWSWKQHQPLIEQMRKAKNIVNVLYNENPYFGQDASLDLRKITSLFDYAFVTSKEQLNEYQNAGLLSHYLMPASDEQTHFYEPQESMKVDVSMVSPTSVYGEAMAIELCNATGITFALYGPEYLRLVAPNCYRGFANQDLARQVFSSSKINIVTHVAHSDGYVNEQVPDILLSKGLMLVDPISVSKSLFTDKESCFVIDTRVPIVEQVKAILALPASERNRIRANGKRIGVKYMTQASWVKTIIEVVGAQ